MRLIDADKLPRTQIVEREMFSKSGRLGMRHVINEVIRIEDLESAPTVDAIKAGSYTAHEVAEIIAELFGDNCACNFNDINEWLPFKCELIDACPNTVGVACWEQYLKYRDERGNNNEADR